MLILTRNCTSQVLSNSRDVTAPSQEPRPQAFSANMTTTRDGDDDNAGQGVVAPADAEPHRLAELQRQLQELLSKQDYTGAAAVQSEREKDPPLMVAAPAVAGQGVVAPADAGSQRLAELQRQLQELLSKQDYTGAAAVQGDIKKLSLIHI